MAKIPGLNISAPVVPSQDTDTYPSHRAIYGQGGWKEVSTVADRDAIPAPRLEAGMAVYVTSTNTLYILQNDLITWSVFSAGDDPVWGNITGNLSDQTDLNTELESLQNQINDLSGIGRYLTTWNCSTGLPETNPTSPLPYLYRTGDYFIVAQIAVKSITAVPDSTTITKVTVEDVAAWEAEEGTDNKTVVFTYNGTIWYDTLDQDWGDLSTLGLTIVGDPSEGDTITVVYISGKNYKPSGSSYTGTPSTTLEMGEVSINDVYLYDGSTWKLLRNSQKKVTFSAITGSPYDNYELKTALDSKVNIVVQPNKIYGTDSTGAATTYDATSIGQVIDVRLNNVSVVQDKIANLVPGASDVSYTNSDYPDMHTLQDAMNKLLYVTPSVSLNGGGTYEIGSKRESTTLTWTWNKAITSQSINQGIGSLDPSLRTYTYETEITSDTTFTITGSDGTNSKSSSTSVKFMPKRYWGVSTETSLTDEQIIALDSELSTTRKQTRTFNCSGGKYFYFAIKTSYCSGIQFKVGGLAFSDMITTTREFTNASGYTDSYNIYRVNNIQTGSAISVEVL